MNHFLVRSLSSRVSSPPLRHHAAVAAAGGTPPILPLFLRPQAVPRRPSFLSSVSPGYRSPATVAATGPAFFHTQTQGGINNKGSQMPRRPAPPPETELDESFLKGSGPGGQKINKTNSAVQLRHLPTGLVIKCQATRSRSENRKIARQLLADRLDDLARGDQSRAAVVGEWRAKKRASSAKKSRRKYRKLEEEKAAAQASADPDADPAPFDEDLLDDPPLDHDQALENRGHDHDMVKPEEREQRPRPDRTGRSKGET